VRHNASVPAAASPRWYALACRFVETSRSDPGAVETFATLGKGPSRSQLCTLRKLAKIHPRIGGLIDEYETPWRVARHIAHGSGPAEQRDRARDELAALVARRQARGKASQLELELLAVLEEPELLEARRGRAA